MVDVSPVRPIARAVTLAEMKATAALAELALIRQSRLSVVPVSDDHWSLILEMAEG
jgi:predicted RNA-binding protein with PUA-like domain